MLTILSYQERIKWSNNFHLYCISDYTELAYPVQYSKTADSDEK